MKAVEIFTIKKGIFSSTERLRKDAEDLINEKHYEGYRLVSASFVADSGTAIAFITMKKPNTY